MVYQTLTVGLTGGIASGKTTVTNLFAEKGIPVIDADVIAHQLVQPGQPALEEIITRFGTKVRYPNGTLNRDALRQLVFNNPAQRQQLEALLHPLILEKLWAEVAQVTTPYCLLSVPLLVEIQMHSEVDHVLVVDCPPDLQKKRLKARSQLTDDDIERILATQTTREKRLAVATEVINNNSTQEALAKQVTQLHNDYLTRAITDSFKKQ